MELKNYQKNVISDLSLYLDLVNKENDYISAYSSFWASKGIHVGFGGVPSYNDTLTNVPHICFKVPTGGGKTFIGCASIKAIFNKMPETKKKVVVWLVPSDTILTQTLSVLKNVNHPYRQRINRDFGNRVEVYSASELNNGQNFNVSSIEEQLSIFVMSFDTFRSRSKENRKVYQENGNLEEFTHTFSNENALIEGVARSASIQVLNQCMPVIIVDESHNATSELSVEMLKNLNPSFVLDLTATPRRNSNVLCYVDAIQLKRASMVKLPVIAYNRPGQQEVITDAIDLRNKLERQALEDERKANESVPNSGRYIRPIVLFQAEPRNGENSTTFDLLKAKLIRAGIPENQIAIKTSEINELRNVELLSRECPIRYIITVNALKEGWDCPFAYVLATLANRSSRVDVEQILGRVLRQPYTEKQENKFLNLSYVLTSSDAFQETLNKIIAGLNNAGFSRNDVRVATVVEQPPVQPAPSEETGSGSLLVEDDNNESDALSFDENKVKEDLEKRNEQEQHDDLTEDENLGGMFSEASEQEETYEQNSESNDAELNNEEISLEIREHSNETTIQNDNIDDESLPLPKFHICTEANLFGETDTPLTKERLTNGFTLTDKPIPTNLTQVTEEAYAVDVSSDSTGSTPNYRRMNANEITAFKNYIDSLPTDSRISACKRSILSKLNNLDSVPYDELQNFVDRIVASLDTDEMVALENNIFAVTDKIKKHINKLIELHRINKFKNLVETGAISIKESYSIPSRIIPLHPSSAIANSLYKEEENDLNQSEFSVITQIAALENVKWWHRIIDRKESEFSINGFINHYPDFMVKTKNGRIVMVEVKGEQLQNPDSQNKCYLGRKWASMSGDKYRYYMVFLNNAFAEEGAVSLEQLLTYLKQL